LKSGALQLKEDNSTYAEPAPSATESNLRHFQDRQALLDASGEVEATSPLITSEVLPLESINMDMVCDFKPTAFTITQPSSSDESSDYVLNEHQTMVHRIVTNHL
jgi:hypothetical protein